PNLTWKGNVNGDWVGPLNWFDVVTLTPAAFSDGARLSFDDTATGTTTINLSSTVEPGGIFIAFANVVSNYSITGTGSIAGTAGLNKTGAGGLTLGVTNSYPGD